MFGGFLSIISLCGAVACTILALVVMVAFAGRQRQRPRDSHTDSPPGPDDTVQRIARILAAEQGGVITADTKRRHSPLLAQELRISLEIANGLQLICEASPAVAAYDSNLALLAKLRTVIGPTDFHFLCARLATGLRDQDPRYAALAAGLQRGDLSWSKFVAELRGMPMEAYRH
jgi:hypothetical protein